MKTLNANLIIEKNKLYSASPFIWLFVLEVDDDTTLYLAAYPENVTFDSQEYTATAAIIESIRDNSQGRLDQIQVHIANADRQISAYVEQTSLISRDVTARIVHHDHLSDADCKIDYTYRINKIQLTEEVATFELGHDDLLKWQIPRQRYIRGRCRFAYKDDYCRHPGDWFDPSTAQDFADARTTGAPFEKLHGWYVYNPQGCSACDCGITNSGYLTITNDAATPYYWYDTAGTGIFIYKEIQGDFEVEAHVPYSDDFPYDGIGVHLMVQFTTETTVGFVDWLSWLWYQDGEDGKLYVCDTDDGVTTPTLADIYSRTWWPYVRIKREDNTFSFTHSQTGADDTWIDSEVISRADATNTVRIGFALHHDTAQTATPEYGIKVDYLKFLSGGAAKCDYTLNGPNGCVAHKNQSRFGGCPAIPYGRLYGI